VRYAADWRAHKGRVARDTNPPEQRAKYMEEGDRMGSPSSALGDVDGDEWDARCPVWAGRTMVQRRGRKRLKMAPWWTGCWVLRT